MIKAVLFDFDGTVCDTLDLCVRSFRLALEPILKRPISDAEITDTFGPTEEGTIRALAPDSVNEGLESFWAHYREEHRAVTAPYEGIIPLITWLKAHHIRTALVTGKGPESCQISLEILGMTKCFDTLRTGSPEGPCKDRLIREVLDEFAVSANEVIYIGDTVSDIESCHDVGVRIISAAWCESVSDAQLQAAHPDALATRVSDVLPILQGYL